jgi:peroxiredoxin
MPEFQNIYDELNPRGFSILAIDFLEGPEPVAAFAEELELSFPIVMDESGAINDMYRIGQYPSSFVVDGHGVIVARHAGILGGAQVLEIIESIDG